MISKHGSTTVLKVDRSFTACAVEDGDELYPNGIFEFNISRILKYIADNPDAVEIVNVKIDDFPPEFSSINESHLASVDVTRPVLIAEIAPFQYNLIDGNHRMAKARGLGMSTMSAYKLTVNQHIGFLTSQRAYLAYVEYWNGKIKSGRQYGFPTAASPLS